MTNCVHEYEDGAYVLGALAPEERVAFERHLSDCDACARSVRDLAGLPGLLSRVPAQIIDAVEPPARVPATLLPSLVRRARSVQRRRLWVTAGQAAAVVAVVGVMVGAVVVHEDGRPSSSQAAGPRAAAPKQLVPVGATVPISGWISLTPVGWGTRLDLTCSYAEEANAYAPAPMYVMVITRSDGTSEQVASWKAEPGRTMHLSAATSANTTDITRIVVRNAAGADVLRLKPVSG